MRKTNSETIKTYISTLQINLSGDEDIADLTPRRIKDSMYRRRSYCKIPNLHLSKHSTQDKSFRDIQSYNCPTQSTDAKKKNDVTSSYRQACVRSKGTFFQLVTSKPERSQEAVESGAYQRGRAYFEGLHNNERRSSSVKNEVVMTKKEEISESSASSQQSSWQTSFSSSADLENECSISSERSLSSLETTRSESSSLMTTTTTSFSTETSIESCDKAFNSSSGRYGETNWYMDILLRMQALDMKQQNLMVQYDFLNKLTDDTRKGFKLAKDWEKYDSDMKKVLEVY